MSSLFTCTSGKALLAIFKLMQMSMKILRVGAIWHGTHNPRCLWWRHFVFHVVPVSGPIFVTNLRTYLQFILHPSGEWGQGGELGICFNLRRLLLPNPRNAILQVIDVKSLHLTVAKKKKINQLGGKVEPLGLRDYPNQCACAIARGSHEVEPFGRGPQSEKQELDLQVQALLLPGFMKAKVYDMGPVKCGSNVKGNWEIYHLLWCMKWFQVTQDAELRNPAFLQ